MSLIVEATPQARSLQEILNVTPAQLREGLSDELLEHSASAQTSEFRSWMRGAGLVELSDRMADHLYEVLDIGLVEIFAGSWLSYEELKRCARDTVKDPSRICEVALTEHEFLHELKVEVEVLLNSSKVASIPFTVSTEWNVQGLTLCIRRGGVYKVRSGTCECSAEIKCAESPIWRHRIRSLSMPGEFQFGTPVMMDG